MKRILVIDDSELVLAMARDALETGGFEVFTASNGIDANKYIFSKSRPDLIILDVMMPMLDGNKKAKILKENQLCKDIPIMLLSSKGEDEMDRLTFEAGVEGYLRKPFTQSDIVKKVTTILSGKR